MSRGPEELQPPETHHLSAAEGWMELGSPAEARSELARIGEPWRRHPAVLEVQWLVRVHEKQWDQALCIAREETEARPEAASGWLHLAYATRRITTGGLEAAWEILRPVYKRFPEEPVIPFNLACYACQLGRLSEARKWLHCAMKTGGAKVVREMALLDDDLLPLRDELRKADP